MHVQFGFKDFRLTGWIFSILYWRTKVTTVTEKKKNALIEHVEKVEQLKNKGKHMNFTSTTASSVTAPFFQPSWKEQLHACNKVLRSLKLFLLFLCLNCPGFVLSCLSFYIPFMGSPVTTWCCSAAATHGNDRESLWRQSEHGKFIITDNNFLKEWLKPLAMFTLFL